MFNEKKEKDSPVNFMGKKCYKETSQMELALAVLSSFLNDSYYESGSVRLNRIVELCKEVPIEFLAKLAVFARVNFGLRSVSHVLIGELSRLARGNSQVKFAAMKVMQRPDDMLEIMAYLGKPYPNQIKKAIRERLNQFSRYELFKYLKNTKNITMSKLIKLVHPTPKDVEQEETFKLIVSREAKQENTWEAMKSAGNKNAFKELLSTGKLGYMATLRNLRNMISDGDTATVKMACDLISKKEAVLKSKQYPFQFLSAYNEVTKYVSENGGSDCYNEVISALNCAIDISCENIPKIQGKIAILSDNSGSMNGGGSHSSVLSANSSRSSADIANLFAAMLYKSTGKQADAFFFGDELIKGESASNSIFDIYKDFSKKASKVGGATEAGIFKFMNNIVEGNQRYDYIVIFSDCQVGDGCNWYSHCSNRYKGHNYNALQKKYLELYPNTKIFSVDLKGYGKEMTIDNRVFKIAGFSDKIFDLMAKSESNLIELINEVEI